MVKNKFYLLIEDRNEIFISSYDDKLLAKKYMLHDIADKILDGAVVKELNSNKDCYTSKDKNISWRILTGLHIDGIYRKFEDCKNNDSKIYRTYNCVSHEHVYFRSKEKCLQYIAKNFYKYYNLDILDQNIKNEIENRIFKILEHNNKFNLLDIEQYGKILNLPCALTTTEWHIDECPILDSLTL